MNRRRQLEQQAAVDEVLSAARRPATPDELRGLDAALAQFRTGPTPAPHRPRRRRAPKAIGAALGLAVLVGGTAAAAAAGALPAGLQRPAHDLFRAPAPSSRHSPVPGRSSA
ncbi:MAG TPA: hypothetical protein VHO01_16140, partial [Jatrophihabitans sp.]|nr:hypothetical protein [Jatrophihabitans sp.]